MVSKSLYYERLMNTRTHLAGEERGVPRFLVLTEEVAAVTEPDELGRAHVRHLRVVFVPLHTSA